MKKISMTLLAIGLSATAGVASAAEMVSSGVAITPEDCTILRDRVTINVSEKVKVAYNCDAANNIVKVAACHEAGSLKPMSITCAGREVTVDGTTSTVYQHTSCTEDGQVVEFEGRRVYTGFSTGGGVGAGSLNSGTCDNAAVGAIADNIAD